MLFSWDGERLVLTPASATEARALVDLISCLAVSGVQPDPALYPAGGLLSWDAIVPLRESPVAVGCAAGGDDQQVEGRGVVSHG